MSHCASSAVDCGEVAEFAPYGVDFVLSDSAANVRPHIPQAFSIADSRTPKLISPGHQAVTALGESLRRFGGRVAGVRFRKLYTFVIVRAASAVCCALFRRTGSQRADRRGFSNSRITPLCLSEPSRRGIVRV